MKGSAGKRSRVCREVGAWEKSRARGGMGRLGREEISAARMKHQEHREVQAGIRNKEGVSGSKGEDKRILKGWAGSRSKSCHQDGTSGKTRSKTWDG